LLVRVDATDGRDIDDGTIRSQVRDCGLGDIVDTLEVYRNQFVEVVFRAVYQVTSGRVNARTIEHMIDAAKISYRVFDGLDASLVLCYVQERDLVRASSAMLGCVPTCFDVDVAECKACSQFAELQCCCSPNPGSGSGEEDYLPFHGVLVHHVPLSHLAKLSIALTLVAVLWLGLEAASFEIAWRKSSGIVRSAEALLEEMRVGEKDESF